MTINNDATSWRELREHLSGQDVADLDYLETFQSANPAYLLGEARKRIDGRQ